MVAFMQPLVTITHLCNSASARQAQFMSNSKRKFLMATEQCSRHSVRRMRLVRADDSNATRPSPSDKPRCPYAFG